MVNILMNGLMFFSSWMHSVPFWLPLPLPPLLQSQLGAGPQGSHVLQKKMKITCMFFFLFVCFPPEFCLSKPKSLEEFRDFMEIYTETLKQHGERGADTNEILLDWGED